MLRHLLYRNACTVCVGPAYHEACLYAIGLCGISGLHHVDGVCVLVSACLVQDALCTDMFTTGLRCCMGVRLVRSF
jgi:hypothetical protein